MKVESPEKAVCEVWMEELDFEHIVSMKWAFWRKQSVLLRYTVKH